jgi:predicted RNA-binding protein (virulence factor B family)
MLEIGRMNQLRVTGILPAGALLDGGEQGAVTLHSQDPTEHFREGDTVSAFVYRDNRGNLTATTRQPLAQVGEVAWLEVLEVNDLGAFLDWGLPKDLFVPFAEQQFKLHKGSHALVHIYLDNRNRITGSTRLDRWVSDEATGLRAGEQVTLIIADRTELGYKAVINHRCWGLLYANELREPIRKGQVLTGFIKGIRQDKKADLSLEKPGYSQDKIDAVAQSILDKLQEHGGHLLLSDKSPPEAIQAVFGVSKKVFKQALGRLYKQRRVSLDKKGISLV